MLGFNTELGLYIGKKLKKMISPQVECRIQCVGTVTPKVRVPNSLVTQEKRGQFIRILKEVQWLCDDVALPLISTMWDQLAGHGSTD